MLSTKKYIRLLTVAVMTVLFIAVGINATGVSAAKKQTVSSSVRYPVPVDEAHFPDPVFREYIA